MEMQHILEETAQNQIKTNGLKVYESKVSEMI